MGLELAKRTTIFYSASFVANMFSGYLQAAVYTGLDGVYGLPGWKWLFIICGVISLPGPVYGLWAIPDSPYNTRARYLNAEDIAFFKKRVVDIGRKPFEGVSVKNMKAMFKNWVVWIYIPVYMYIFPIVCDHDSTN